MSLRDPRRTGRTTRLLDRAAELLREGRYVFVLCADQQQRHDLARQLAERFPPDVATMTKGPTTKVYAGGGQASFESISSDVLLDPRRGRVIGSHPSCEVLIDHYALSTHFRWVLEQWEQANKETP